MAQQQYTATNNETGKTITFNWHLPSPPTDADMEDVFAVATGAAPKRPEEILAASDPNYIPREEQAALGPRALDRAPAIGSGVGATLGGIPGAAGGGFLGGLVRGDSLADASREGAAQGLYQTAGGIAGRGVVGAGKWIAKQADPLIQSAVKPALAELRSIAGRTGSSMAGEARRISGLIRRTGIRTPEQAEAGIRAAEQRVQGALKSVGPDAENVTAITDAPQRAMRYLGKLERSASRQMSPADDLRTVAGERAKFVKESPMFQNVTRTEPAIEGLVGSGGLPVAPISRTVRVPRANVTAGESLELARGTSRHATRKAYGEQKGMSTEAQKALDRAGRDAAKSSAPESMRADLRQQGDLIRLKPILDRMGVRQMNRDAMSLPGIVGAAPSIAQGKVPVLGMVAQWMRNNQLRAGVGAHYLGGALQSGGQSAGQLSPQVVRLLDILMRGRSSNEAP